MMSIGVLSEELVDDHKYYARRFRKGVSQYHDSRFLVRQFKAKSVISGNDPIEVDVMIVKYADLETIDGARSRTPSSRST